MEDLLSGAPNWLSVVLVLLLVLYSVLWFLMPVCVYYAQKWTWKTYLETKKSRELLERIHRASQRPAPLPLARPARPDEGRRLGGAGDHVTP